MLFEKHTDAEPWLASSAEGDGLMAAGPVEARPPGSRERAGNGGGGVSAVRGPGGEGWGRWRKALPVPVAVTFPEGERTIQQPGDCGRIPPHTPECATWGRR